MESLDFYEYTTISKEDYSKYCDNTFGIILIITLNGNTMVVNSDKIESIKLSQNVVQYLKVYLIRSI